MIGGAAVGLLNRVITRLHNEDVSIDVLAEYIRTVSDRLCLRLGANELPPLFESVCVDAVIKMVRRAYYEGISSESVANINTSFVDDVLSEYDAEISDWKNGQAASGNSNKVVTFL